MESSYIHLYSHRDLLAPMDKRFGLLRMIKITGVTFAGMVALQIMSPAGTPLQQLTQQISTDPEGEKLVSASDCASCHAPDRQVVGPAYAAVAKRYAGQDDAVEKLATRIREGGSGNWGAVTMPPHKNITDAQSREMVRWVLSLKPSLASETRSETK